LQKNEDLIKMRGLVVAGPGDAKGQLIKMCSASPASRQLVTKRQYACSLNLGF
jgi:hypothetical protein